MMRKLRAWLLRMVQSLSSIGRARRDRDLADELENHLAMHIEDNLRAGMAPEEARRQAVLRLGGIDQTKERYRDRLSLPWLDSLFADVRYGARMLARGRGFSVVLILILAFGIGSVTAMYTIADRVLFHPMPFSHPEQIMTIYGITAPQGVAPLQYWAHNTAFDEIAQVFPGGRASSSANTASELRRQSLVTIFFPFWACVRFLEGSRFDPRTARAPVLQWC